VQLVEGVPKDISAGQVVWAPPPSQGEGKQYLVFVGWTSYSSNFSTTRKLGMKYCYNRPCALYAIEVSSGPRYDMCLLFNHILGQCLDDPVMLRT
jgi:acylaminoacyl-peptidase